VNVSEPQQHSGPAGKLQGMVGCLERAAKRRGKKAGKRKEEMSTEGKRRKKKSLGINYGRLLRRVSMYVLLFFVFVVLPFLRPSS